MIQDMRTGRLNLEKLSEMQRRLDKLKETLDESTADEEESTAGQEAHELNEEDMLGGVLASSLADLEAELSQVHSLLSLARRVYATGKESKFEKLREVLSDSRYRHEKLLIFTEHRDTLYFLVQRLEGMGFTGKIAQIHGGMNYQEREVQVAAFRQPVEEGGALYADRALCDRARVLAALPLHHPFSILLRIVPFATTEDDLSLILTVNFQ